MEITEAKKLTRTAQASISVIINNLAKETGANVELELDYKEFMGEVTRQYIAKIKLSL